MRFSSSSILMAVLTSNLLIIFTHLIFQKKKLLLNIGYKIIGIFLFLTVLRFLFPFELPITTNINFPELPSRLIANFTCPRFNINNINISFFNIFELIWLLGIIYLTCKTLILYLKFHNLIISCSTPVSNEMECQQIVEQICKKHGKKVNVRILTAPVISAPMVCYWKGYCIFLPKMSFSSKELYYILSHELVHIFSHDLLLKLGIQLLSIFYWWNPFCYLLKKQCDLLLEMRIDETLTNGDHKTKVAYLTCLLRVLNESSEKPASSLGISFCQNKTSAVSYRFYMLMKSPSPNKKHFSFNLLFVNMIIFLYIASFFVIFEAKYMPDSIKQTTEGHTKENTQIYYNDNGTYSIYFNGILVETTDSLRYYPDNLPIYKKGELYEEN